MRRQPLRLLRCQRAPFGMSALGTEMVLGVWICITYIYIFYEYIYNYICIYIHMYYMENMWNIYGKIYGTYIENIWL